jgi:hypothetical protein
MTPATVEKSAPEQTDRELEHELRAERARTQRVAAELLDEYRAASFVERTIERDGILTSPDAAPKRTLRSPAKPQGRKLATVEEREIEQEAARERRRAIGLRLAAAKVAADEARAAHVDYVLRKLAPEHERAADETTDAARRLEAAYLRFVVAAIEHAEAQEAESMVGRRLVKLASEACADDDQRAQLRHRAVDEVPVRIEGGSFTYRPRPSRGLFGHEADAWVLPNDAAFAEMQSLIRGGRARIGGCRSERVAARLEKALRERD